MVRTIKRLLPLMVSMMMLSGCAMMESDPKAELLIAQRSFIAVVDSLSELRDADVFDEEELVSITKLILSGDRLLDMWVEEIINERAFDGSDVFYHVLGELIEHRDRGEIDGL